MFKKTDLLYYTFIFIIKITSSQFIRIKYIYLGVYLIYGPLNNEMVIFVARTIFENICAHFVPKCC